MGKLRNGLDLIIKDMDLILSIKTHVVIKREIYSKEIFKDGENRCMVYSVCRLKVKSS